MKFNPENEHYYRSFGLFSQNHMRKHSVQSLNLKNGAMRAKTDFKMRIIFFMPIKIKKDFVSVAE